MKHFLIALILLLVIVACVCVNGFIVRGMVKDTLKLTRALPETQEEFENYHGDIQEFVDKWYARHGYLSLSIHMCELERACEAVADIKACIKTKTYEDFIAAKCRLEAVLIELADGEKPTFINIF